MRGPHSSGPVRRKSIATPPDTAPARPRHTTRTHPALHPPVLHNWLYFIALGFSIPNLPRVIATIVNEDGSAGVTPASTRLKGDVEAVDKILTFCGVGFLGALSDVKGRKPLMAWSALGFGLTLLIQGLTTQTSHLYLADVVDGLSSCMGAVCTSYVADCSAPDKVSGWLCACVHWRVLREASRPPMPDSPPGWWIGIVGCRLA